jgi:putative ABC transport system permease protein
MFKNYFKTALRTLLRYKGFSFINILSLTVGVIGCLIIGVFVWDENQYDKFLPENENIYRLYNESTNGTTVTNMAVTPPAYASFLQKQYPEVDTAVRILMARDQFLMETGEKKNYENKGWFVEPGFFKMFPVKLLKGDPITALTEPTAVVLSEELANKYFGSADPIGKTIKIDKTDYTVKAVFAKLPKHFHLNFNYLMALKSAGIPEERMQKWGWTQFYTYVKLKPGTDAKNLESKFKSYVKTDIAPKEMTADNYSTPFFQPLKDIHLRSSDFVYDNAIRGNQTYVKALSIIALFVLAIACFNFVNLSTARSFRRAKEIGVRKVVGAERKQLIIQFLGETVMLSVFSVILATVATVLLIPALNQFTEKSIEFNPITNPILLLLISGGGILIGIIAGIYPALVLSGFQPMKVLKNMKVAGSGSHTAWIRQALVVVQFALSALLIVATIIVYKQTQFLNNKDLGFNKEQVIYFQIRGGVVQNLETFKNELRSSSNIVSVTSGYGLPGDQFAGDGVKLVTPQGEVPKSVSLFIGDHDYIKTLGLRLIAGRDFSREMKTDEAEAFIINETAAKEWGFASPEKALGQRINWDKWAPDSLNPVKKGKVIGVIQDFHYKSLHEKVIATVIQIYPQEVYKIAAKMKTADAKNTLAFIQNTWNKFSPEYPLEYKFMDETYGKMYSAEQKLSQLLWIFTLMAIAVGCMGLFGLAAFSAEQRTKEIGVRKVLGANVLNIVALLSKSFLKLVFIASLIAFPIAWWAMNNWLEDFPYRVAISWWIFGVAAVAALLIAFITVSFQSIKAATANPVRSLRSE